MAVVACIAAAAVVLLIVAGIVHDIKTNPRTIFTFGKVKPPVYQWVQAEDKTLSFLPGEGKAWGPVEPQGGEIHYAISSYLPVDTGLMGAEWAERMDGWSAMKSTSTCYEGRITSSSKICRMETAKPYLIFIRDIRTKQFVLGETPVFGNKKALQEQNNVTITTFTRKCMENCK
jgi:hypothetical protein